MAGVGAAYMNREALQPIWVKYTKYWGKVQTPEALAEMKPKATFQDCTSGSSDCPVMVVIEGGKFMMGSAEDDPDAQSDGYPLREVTVPRFAVSETEITYADWEMCAASGGCRKEPRPGDTTWGPERQSVVNVSWEDSQQYVRWLSSMTGVSYRLLSEAEWEYVARASTTTTFSFGDTDASPDSYAWSDNNSDTLAHPVREKKRNAFGLYDLHGNDWEWVEDCYADGYSAGEPSDGRAFARGNCTNRSPPGVELRRSAIAPLGAPQMVRPTLRSDYLGFRVARTL